MKTEARGAGMRDSSKLATKYPTDCRVEQRSCGDAEEESTSSTTLTVSSHQSRRSWVRDVNLPPPAVHETANRKSADEGPDSIETDDDDESDSSTTTSVASTSNELSADMQNLQLRCAEAVEQSPEPLVGRGPTGETATCQNGDCQSSPMQDNTNKAASLSYVRCKRKITSASVGDLRLADITETSSPVGRGCQHWTVWSDGQHGGQATKIRRSGGDPQESDDSSSVTFDPTLTSLVTSSLTSALSSGIGGCCNGDSFSSPAEICSLGCGFASEEAFGRRQYYAELDLDPLGWANGIPQQLDASVDEWDTLICGNLLSHVNEIGPPIENWSLDPVREVATRGHNTFADSIRSETATTNGENVASKLFTRAGPSNDAVSVNQPNENSLHPPHSALDSSMEGSRVVEVRGNSSSRPYVDTFSPFIPVEPDDRSPHQRRRWRHDLPSDVIFEYVEDKLRELVSRKQYLLQIACAQLHGPSPPNCRMYNSSAGILMARLDIQSAHNYE